MQPGSKNPPFLPAPCPGDVCTHTGARVRHILQPPSTALPRTESHCPRAVWQGPASGPHERGPGTSPAGTQLLLAPNKGHLTARTARCLWVQQEGQGTQHPAATRTSPAARQGQHRDSTGPAQGHSSAPRTSSGAGCPRDQTLSPPTPTGTSAQAAHQFSLLMWSPKPGVSMTVSFMRTPFSSISAMRRKQLCEAAPENTCRSGPAPPPAKKSAFTAFPGTNQPSRELSTTSALKLSPPPPTPLVPHHH